MTVHSSREKRATGGEGQWIDTAKFMKFRQIAPSAGWSRAVQLLPRGKTTNPYF
jgi:hypothetical protein